MIKEDDPKSTPLKELTENSVGFRVKQERSMDCQAINPPKELQKPPAQFLYSPPVNRTPPKKERNKGTYQIRTNGI